MNTLAFEKRVEARPAALFRCPRFAGVDRPVAEDLLRVALLRAFKAVAGRGLSHPATLVPAADRVGSAATAVSAADGECGSRGTFVATVTGSVQETWRSTRFGSTTAGNGAGADESEFRRAGVPVGASGRRFLRLEVTQP